jgi:O-antigen ligase
MMAETLDREHVESSPIDLRRVSVAAICGVAIAFAAIQSTTISNLGPPAEHFRAWLTAPLGAALLALCVRDLTTRSWKRGPGLYLGIWIAWSCVSAVLGDDVVVSLSYSLAFAGIGAAVVTISDRFGWAGVCATLIWGGICYGVAAALAPLVSDRYSTLGSERLRLLSLEPNQLGQICAIAIMAALYLAWRARGVWSIPPIIVLMVASWGLLATDSRTAIGALLAALALLVFSYIALPLRLLGVGLVLAAITFAFGLGIVDADFDWLSRKDDASQDVTNLSGRTELWPAIIEGSADRPIAGVGMGIDGAFMSELRHEGKISFTAPHSHSILLHPLITTGFVGFALFAAALFAMIGRAIVSLEPWRDSMLLLLVIDGVSEAVIRVPSFGWAALVAVAVTAGPLRRRVPLTARSHDRPAGLVSTKGS